MLRSGTSLRALALLAAAAFGVHQGSYLLTGADEAGHAYLSDLVPALGALLIVAAGHFAAAVWRARGHGTPAVPRRAPFAVLWLGATAALSALFIGQEWIEGLLGPGGSAGLAAAGAHGMWPPLLAAVLGALVALLLRGADAAIAAASSRARPAVVRARGMVVPRTPVRAGLPGDPLASHLAGRGPPLLAA